MGTGTRYAPEVKAKAEDFVTKNAERLERTLGTRGDVAMSFDEGCHELRSEFGWQPTEAEAIYDEWSKTPDAAKPDDSS